MRTVLHWVQSLQRALQQKSTPASRCILATPGIATSAIVLARHRMHARFNNMSLRQYAAPLHMQLLKSMKATLIKQTADALKACEAAAKPAKSAKTAAAAGGVDNVASGRP